MREIKFRAWDKEQNKMLSHEEIDQLDKDGVANWMDIIKPDNKENMIVMQYTGFKDRNGVEIYEGDVVSVPYVTPDGKITDTVDYTASVVFKSGSFCITGHEQGTFVLLSNWCIPTGVNYVSNYGEVIQISNNTYLTTTGNIHTKTETHVQP